MAYIGRAVYNQQEAILRKPVLIDFEATDTDMLPEDFDPTVIKIQPATIETFFSVLPYLTQLSEDDLKVIVDYESDQFDAKAPEIFKKYAATILEVVLIALVNQNGSYEPWFRTFIERNCTWDDLHVFLTAILYRMGGAAFYQSIIQVKGMSPWRAEEIIALKNNANSHLIPTPLSSK